MARLASWRTALAAGALLLSACTNSTEPISVRQTDPTPPSTDASSTDTAPSTPQDFAFVIDDLPTDFEQQPLFLCVANEGAFVGYVGEGDREGTAFDDVYEGAPFLRMAASLGGGPGWLDRLSGRSDESSDESSDQPIELGDAEATLFSVTTPSLSDSRGQQLGGNSKA